MASPSAGTSPPDVVHDGDLDTGQGQPGLGPDGGGDVVRRSSPSCAPGARPPTPGATSRSCPTPARCECRTRSHSARSSIGEAVTHRRRCGADRGDVPRAGPARRQRRARPWVRRPPPSPSRAPASRRTPSGSSAPAKKTCLAPTAAAAYGMPQALAWNIGTWGSTASPGPIDMPAWEVTAKACRKVERWV